GRIAVDLSDVRAFERPCDERRPHSSVERGQPWVRANERAKRARRGRDHSALFAHLRDRYLVTEASESGTDPAQCSSERLHRTKSRLASEFSPERDADFV